MRLSLVKYAVEAANFFLRKITYKKILHQSTGNSLVWGKSVLRIEIREEKNSGILTVLRVHFASLIQLNSTTKD